TVVIIILLSCVLVVFFFFFQAEDGIRDDLVTGVQTCALPIFLASKLISAFEKFSLLLLVPVSTQGPVNVTPGLPGMGTGLTEMRSEERRVGKEGRYGWGRCE